MLNAAVAFFLILVALLAVPVRLRFHTSSRQLTQNDVMLEWAFGLVRVRVPARQTKPQLPKNDKFEETGRFRPPFGKHQNVFAAVRQKPFRRRILRFVTDLWRAVYKEDINVSVRIGLGDPAETGQLWAVLGPLAGTLASAECASIKIEPEFADSVFDVDSSGSIRLMPLRFIYLSVALLLSVPFWRGLSQMRSAE